MDGRFFGHFNPMIIYREFCFYLFFLFAFCTSVYIYSLLQNRDARIIVTACYEDKARLLLCEVSLQFLSCDINKHISRNS